MSFHKEGLTDSFGNVCDMQVLLYCNRQYITGKGKMSMCLLLRTKHPIRIFCDLFQHFFDHVALESGCVLVGLVQLSV